MDRDEIARIAEILLRGGVVLLPTDTIYGLHAVATDDAAVARIAALKGRDDTKPFVVLAASLDHLRLLGITAPANILAALDELWPAPLTAVLPLVQPIAASRGMASLAVRIPALDWLRDLISRTGPLVSTSANRSGEPPVDEPSNLAQELLQSLDGLVDLGPCNAQPSAILDLTRTEPQFLRQGEASFTQKVWKTLRKSL